MAVKEKCHSWKYWHSLTLLLRFSDMWSLQSWGLLPARVWPQGVFNRFIDSNLGGRRVGRSAAGLPGGGGGVGTPTYVTSK